jgi:hypothetical protein
MAINKTLGLFQVSNIWFQVWGAFDCEDGSGDRLLQAAVVHSWGSENEPIDVEFEGFENPWNRSLQKAEEFRMLIDESIQQAVSRFFECETSGIVHTIA